MKPQIEKIGNCIHVSPECLWFEIIVDQTPGLNQCIHATSKMVTGRTHVKVLKGGMTVSFDSLIVDSQGF